MKVIKRNGDTEEMSFDKIMNRTMNISEKKGIKINHTELAIKIIKQLKDNIKTKEIDELIAYQCSFLSSSHIDYSILSSYVIISNHQKNTKKSFYDVMYDCYHYIDSNGDKKPILSDKTWEFIELNREKIEEMIDYERDYLIDYFGFKTLENAYLIKINNDVVERIQHLWMRVSIGIHGDVENMERSLLKIKETYDWMSQKYFIHATPTLFNAGTINHQMSSCYLIAMEEDSIHGIYSTLYDCAQISKFSGGIGIHIHNIRGNGSKINGTNGNSNGIIPMLQVFNSTAKYVDQGGNKRKGSFAIYIEPWHYDIEEFLQLKKITGDEVLKARDLFYGLWIPDLFMERIKNKDKWTLFSPDEFPGLQDVYGEKFERLYLSYEDDITKENNKKKQYKVMNARDLWLKILDSQIESSNPYLLFKDACNRKSNQQNLGTIQSSNLCTEIIQYSDKNETSVCNLASIGLPMFVNKTTKEFDYEKLHAVSKVLTENLNRIIDINFYPTPKTKTSNLKHRPIGIGIQGLADTFILLDIAFDSEEAREINKCIFETIYHGALEKSLELSIEYGPYSSFEGSPISKGLFQFDLWNVTPSQRYNWNALREKIQIHGIRNSLLLAPMPTATTSQILGFTECFEPITTNLYSRSTLSGSFLIVNKYLMKDLIDLGLWNDYVKKNIEENKGSIQQLTHLDIHLRNKYKTAWEISPKSLINLAVDRGAYICQSQSMSLWVEDPDYTKLTNMHFYSWKNGLKTGIYYLRRKPKHQPQQFTIEPEFKDNDDSICEYCCA
jgi:ribonucleoside-diphosphate reductase alpha subunit